MQFRPSHRHSGPTLVAFGTGAQVLAGTNDSIAWLLPWLLVAMASMWMGTLQKAPADQKKSLIYI